MIGAREIVVKIPDQILLKQLHRENRLEYSLLDTAIHNLILQLSSFWHIDNYFSTSTSWRHHFNRGYIKIVFFKVFSNIFPSHHWNHLSVGHSPLSMEERVGDSGVSISTYLLRERLENKTRQNKTEKKVDVKCYLIN